MKKFFLSLLLFIPLFSIAQEDLLGKSQQDVLTAMKEANYPHMQLGMSKAKIGKLTHYDKFKTGDRSSITCYYYNNPDAICYKVSEVRGLASADSIRQALDSNAVKVKKDTWTSKAGDVKIVLTVSKKYNFVATDYAPIDKRGG